MDDGANHRDPPTMPELTRPRPLELTSRERQVLLLARDGWQERPIAFLLGIEPEDVARHLGRVSAKLGADRPMPPTPPDTAIGRWRE